MCAVRVETHRAPARMCRIQVWRAAEPHEAATALQLIAATGWLTPPRSSARQHGPRHTHCLRPADARMINRRGIS